ncbi:unnamed protein product [Adineta steineri]|uniref:Polyketide synthase dehydratase domain-containing protein n=1 Tax=Adineta steineri TaxID=433720 RepID=A0A814GS97_9BILA|nr:unnamed protein product [Adineta steineri]
MHIAFINDWTSSLPPDIYSFVLYIYDVTLQDYIAVYAKGKLYSSVNADKMNDSIPVDNEATNLFLEISPHPVLVKSTRECYELTNQQQSSPLILLTLKRKENEQTSATWKSLININLPQHAYLKDHIIQDAILFPAVASLELATAACQHLLSSKEDDQQQQPTIIFEDVNFIKALILNEHELVETLHGTLTTIISQLSNDNNNCSSYYLLHPYLVLLPGIETTFLPVRIQKFIYSSKTKTKINQSTNIEVRSNYYDNICGTSQEEIYNLDLWIFPMNNKIEEPIFTFECIIIQEVQRVKSSRWSMKKTIYDKLNLTTDLPNKDHSSYLNTIIEDYCMKRVWTDSPIIKDRSGLLPSPNQILNNQLNSISNQDLIESIEPFNELAAYYAQMAIKDLGLNHIHHPLLNACRSLVSTLHSEQIVTWNSTQLRLVQLFERFPRLKPFLIMLNKYDLHLKDILSGEENSLDIFVDDDDDEIGETFQQVKFLLKSFDIIFSSNQLQRNQDLTKKNSLIVLRRLLVPNGLLLLLELVHVPLYFDLIFCFFDQWWSSDNDNHRALNNIQQWTTLVEQIEGFNIIESTLNQNESTLIISQKTTSKEILQTLDERINQTWLIFAKDDNNKNSFSHILSSFPFLKERVLSRLNHGPKIA